MNETNDDMFITSKRRYSNNPITTISTTGNWVAPEGYHSIKVEAWGGGKSGYQGGRGGSYARLDSYSVSAGNSYFISVGRGGISANLSSQTISSGSYFVTQSLLYAATGAETSIGDVTYSGGYAGTGSVYPQFPGGGGSAFEYANGGDGSGIIGGIGKGNGGNGSTGYTGSIGNIPGGGGGGGESQFGLNSGGNGANGLVYITKLN